MSTAMWKLEKDLCRCCHAEGSFKHLSDPCFQLGQEEIYSDMLQDCLDIKIIPMTGVLTDITYTICETCVARLRDASNFKRQVQDCEERFKDMYSKNLIRGFKVKEEPSFNESDDMKQEFQSIDEDDDDAFLNFDDDADADVSLDGRQQITIEVESKAKGKGKAKPKPKPKKPTPVKKTKKEKSIKMETEELTVAAVSGEKKKGSLKCKNKIPKKEEATIKRNLKCTEAVLNSPTSSNSPDYSQEEIKVEVDMKPHLNLSLQCPLCDEKLKSKCRKRTHLRSKHNMKETGRGNSKRLTPISKYICDYCNNEFSSRRGIFWHLSRVHYSNMTVKCPDCPIMLTLKALPKHRNKAHGTYIPTCGVCGYQNTEEFKIEKHQRQVHLSERNVACKLCDKSFFNVSGLRRHLVVHTRERKYECSFCHKKFLRVSSRSMHEKIHKGEKNKVCKVCGARFVQKSGLNYHMNKHHPEVSY